VSPGTCAHLLRIIIADRDQSERAGRNKPVFPSMNADHRGRRFAIGGRGAAFSPDPRPPAGAQPRDATAGSILVAGLKQACGWHRTGIGFKD